MIKFSKHFGSKCDMPFMATKLRSLPPKPTPFNRRRIGVGEKLLWLCAALQTQILQLFLIYGFLYGGAEWASRINSLLLQVGDWICVCYQLLVHTPARMLTCSYGNVPLCETWNGALQSVLPTSRFLTLF